MHRHRATDLPEVKKIYQVFPCMASFRVPFSGLQQGFPAWETGCPYVFLARCNYGLEKRDKLIRFEQARIVVEKFTAICYNSSNIGICECKK